MALKPAYFLAFPAQVVCSAMFVLGAFIAPRPQITALCRPGLDLVTNQLYGRSRHVDLQRGGIT